MKDTPDFDFKTGEFRLNGGDVAVLRGIDALRLWVQKTIKTQLNRYSIYKGKAYGANIEDLVIGKTYGFDFVESELRREVETALLRHEDIESLSKAIGAFMFEVLELPQPPTEFDTKLWIISIEDVTVHSDGRMIFKFKNGTEIEM